MTHSVVELAAPNAPEGLASRRSPVLVALWAEAERALVPKQAPALENQRPASGQPRATSTATRVTNALD